MVGRLTFGCSPHWSGSKTSTLSIVISSFFFYLLLHGQTEEGNSSQVLLHTFNLSLAVHTHTLPPSLPPVLPVLLCPPCHILCRPPIHLSSLCLSVIHPLSHSLSLSFPLSWRKVMEADMCGSPRARLRDYTARSHERFMMLVRVCVCVYVCPKRSGTD